MVDRYIVAPRREARDAAPEGWLALLTEVEGVEVLGAYGGRAQIACEPQAAAAVRDVLGDGFHVEPVFEHYPSTDDPPARSPGMGRDRWRPKPI